MDEIHDRLAKYDAAYIQRHLTAATDVNEFAGIFYADVAEIYDTITRVRNVERNPTGFGYNDAPILGLLVRSWKLLKEVVRYYKEDNGEVVGIIERPLLEAVVTARYLLSNDDAVIEDYRKCSYKDRLRILQDAQDGVAFAHTKPGKRLANSIRAKLRLEGLSTDDFEEQKRHRWKIQGKTFYDLFAAVEHEELYRVTYGMMSESIHGSWNDSLDFDLLRGDDNTFSAYPFYQSADIRYVTPLIRFSNPAYRDWLQRIEAHDPNLFGALDWIDTVNMALYRRFDETFDGP